MLTEHINQSVVGINHLMSKYLPEKKVRNSPNIYMNTCKNKKRKTIKQLKETRELYLHLKADSAAFPPSEHLSNSDT